MDKVKVPKAKNMRKAAIDFNNYEKARKELEEVVKEITETANMGFYIIKKDYALEPINKQILEDNGYKVTIVETIINESETDEDILCYTIVSWE